ncbi:hypothetical protein [Streptomyces sp. NPDC001604]|uniref:hypothetical protein n=1 Tax=Streptomyces sp. NPDC001604 TaxID=3364593 RepID=UPI0036ACA0E4
MQIASALAGIGVDVVESEPPLLESGGDLADAFGLALVAAAGEHHPGPGGGLDLQRVGLDAAGQRLLIGVPPAQRHQESPGSP